MRHQQYQCGNSKTQHSADFAQVHDIRFQKTRNPIHVVVFEPHVIVAEQIDLRPSDAARL
jgi:hypothetical protein